MLCVADVFFVAFGCMVMWSYLSMSMAIFSWRRSYFSGHSRWILCEVKGNMAKILLKEMFHFVKQVQRDVSMLDDCAQSTWTTPEHSPQKLLRIRHEQTVHVDPFDLPCRPIESVSKPPETI